MSTFVVLGTGDLTTRYLMPALVELEGAGVLPGDLLVVGAARHEMTSEAFRDELRDSGLDDADPSAVNEVLGRVEFVTADATDSDSLARLPISQSGPVWFYLALPPAIFAEVFKAIASLELGDRLRIAIEKPFGEDQASARALNQLLDELFDHSQVFRVDHFLGQPVARALLGLAAANPLISAGWSGDHIESISLIWDETLALEGRAGYYDGIGALRDMLQNHLLQLMVLTTMEPPASPDATEFSRQKLALLRRVTAVPDRSVRARYGSGELHGEPVPAYVDEEGVDPDRCTETFAEVVLEIDTNRWRGVPIRLRSAKAMGTDRRCIRIQYWEVEDTPFQVRDGTDRDHLTIGIQPGAIHLGLAVASGPDPGDLMPIEMSVGLPGQPLSAYAQVLADLFEGDQRFFITGEEAEEQWRIVAPVLESWSEGDPPILEYRAGSDGP